MVGIEGEEYAAGNSGSQALSQAFTAFAAGYGIVCDNEKSSPGDNISF
ncbi:MAG: hypothetical protein LBS19_11155 [Clostridiales bacterium]|jgi:hypothetical protein|nr:hypothetical protein [Clostridiales bacterium]